MTAWLRTAGAILAVVLLAGCTNGPAPAARPSEPVINPSPLAHLTYECNVIPAATASATGEPLFYLEPFDDPGSGPMCALNWEGKLQGQIGKGLALRQSADGARLLVIDYPIVNDSPDQYVVIDETGTVLARTSSVWRDEAMWADDSRHLCYVRDSNASGRGGVAYLELMVPDSSARRVSTVGFITYVPGVSSGGPAPVPFISGPHLLACSIRSNRALVLDPDSGTVSLIRLSDGAELMRHVFGRHFAPYNIPGHDETLVASIDGRYVAHNIEGSSTVTIVDLLSNSVVASLKAASVAGFSWDASLAVVGLDAHVVAVVAWKSGAIIRRLAGAYPWSRARPGTDDVLVGVPSTRHAFGLDLYIVRADGLAFEVARSVDVVTD